MLQSREFGIKKDSLAPEFPRKKEIKRKTKKRRKNKELVHEQHNTFGASWKMMI